MEQKSANKRWKESKSSLSFKEWISRENNKKEAEGNFLPFVAGSIQDTLNRSKEEIRATAGFKTTAQEDESKVFGLDKGVLIFSSLLIVGSLGFYFYGKLKNRK
jgi:hypothetical protein